MARAHKKIQSSMGWSNESSITVQGYDLSRDILGKLNLGDFAFLEIKGRTPSPAESVVFNAVLGTLVEHGMTPMVIAARLTYLGAPESLQGAVAAGIQGMGTTFAGTAEGSARLLQDAIKPDTMPADLPALAEEIVARHIASKTSIPGIGHHLKLVASAAERALNKPGLLPVNATGAIGALSSELAIPWKLCRGLAVIGRTIGIVGHLAEELRNPIAREVWERIEEEASEHNRT